MISCQNVTKSYRGRVAVNAVSLTVSGGICGLLGANGAGKSTLLKIMTGLVAADGGTVTIAGYDIAAEPAAVKQLIGVVPEEIGLFESLSISENLQLVGPIYGLAAEEIQLRTAELLEILGLGGSRHKLVSECSYGMRKKTALAMALLHNPRVLFLDEPFEGIDPSSSRTIQRALAGAAERGTTILLTSHILPMIETLASRVIILKHGKLVWDSELESSHRFNADTYFQFVDDASTKELTWLGS
jgi:ABC-2 type transport system ATP-binding protein